MSLHFDRYLSMSTYNHKETARLAYDISEQLISHGIDVWLEYGSALGAARDGGIANGDSDIDLAIWWKDWEKFKNIMVTEKIRTNVPYVYNFRIFPEGEVLKVKVADSSTVLDVDKKGYTDTIFIDIYGMQEYDGIKSSVINYGSAYRSKLYYQKNLKKIKFEGFDFCVSKYVEKYLDYLYKGAGGETWRTPVARSKTDNNWEDAMPTYHKEDEITGCAEGVFDMYHKGHVRLFQKMKDIFDKVVAVVTPDEVVANYKSTPPVFCYEERVEILRSCKYIDEVIPATKERPISYTTIKWMEENDIDYMVHGKTDEKFLRIWYDEPMNEERLLLLDETPDYHTSDLRKKSLNRV